MPLSLLLLAPLALPGTLNGTWIQSCDRGVSRTESISDSGATRLEEHFFSDAACAKPSYVFTSEGTSEFLTDPLPAPEWPEGARAVNFAFSRVTLLFQSQGLVDWANGIGLCGSSQWAPGVALEVTGKFCAFFSQKPVHVPSAGDQRFGIYQVIEPEDASGPSLQWGQLTQKYDGQSPAARPRAWDPGQIYRRIEHDEH